ncbi:Gfo/Idh/MocA family oxidoreductase [Cetobacterium sp. 8H]|uniref:Gfo/Idh/MocA family protein n=1 Tax=Cetobacterium sp. 8H TaxID=2759681 RepID=UPI00163C9200|nr:Gfo/Idh/MocA family oxidoreductase [Cetobacterium sp. 8H]MBC2852063.1 Gfo/Idh/MocA family oxidoreductase [Cetobacterium sp. 8H]
MKKIRVGIIGCGSITEKRHAPEYLENPNVEIVAFYDLNEKRAMLMVEKFGGKAVKDYKDILEDPSIDAISDCTPNNMHCLISTKAMELGKHVLCEKPMSKTLEEALKIIDVQNKTGKIFMLDHNQRFTKAHRKVKELIKNGKLGKILTFRTTFGHSGPESWSENKSKNTWFFKKDLCEFGVLGDLGVHKIDLIRFLTNQEFKSVCAMAGTLNKTFENGEKIEVYDNAICILKTEEGTLGTGTFSWSYYGEEDNSTILYFEKGIIRIYDNPIYQIIIIYNDGTVEKLQIESIQTNSEQTKTGVIDEFIQCILENKESTVTAYDGFISIKVVHAIMKSIEEKQEIAIDLN